MRSDAKGRTHRNADDQSSIEIKQMETKAKNWKTSDEIRSLQVESERNQTE